MLQRCICKRVFLSSSAYTQHCNTCPKARAETKQRHAWHRREVYSKRRREDHSPNSHSSDQATADIPITSDHDSAATPHSGSAGSTCPPDDVADDEPSPTSHRPSRLIRLPKRFQDFVSSGPKRTKKPQNVLPAAQAGLPPDASSPSPRSSRAASSPPSTSAPEDEGARASLDSSKNAFGLFRRFFGQKFPAHDPDAVWDDGSCADSEGEDDFEHDELRRIAIAIANSSIHRANILHNEDENASDHNPFYPYPNYSAYRLGQWFHNGAKLKSKSELRSLLDILRSGEIDLAELRDVDFDRIDALLAPRTHTTPREGVDPSPVERDKRDDMHGLDWTCTPVSIEVPLHSRKKDGNSGPQEFRDERGFYHRNLCSIIKETVEDPDRFAEFHLEPYELYFQPHTDVPPERVHGEVYTSNAFLREDAAIQSGPGEPNCDLERVTVAVMFGSDVVHLSQFGENKLWPLYVGFGNHSKYRRTKPGSKLMEIAAFFKHVSLAVTRLDADTNILSR